MIVTNAGITGDQHRAARMDAAHIVGESSQIVQVRGRSGAVVSRRSLALMALGLGGLYLTACASSTPIGFAPTATTVPPAAPVQPTATGVQTTAAAVQPTATGGVKLAGPEVRLGALVPSSGPLAEWGRKNTISLKVVEDEVNGAGGIGGVPLKIIVYDTAAKPDQAATLIRKLAQDDKVLALAGPLTSGECEVVFPLANQLKIVSMSQASSKPGVAAANRPYAFRNTVDEAVMAKLTVKKFIEMFKVSKPAVMYDIKDAVSSALGKAILPKEFDAEGVKVINMQDPVTFQTTDTDLAAQITKLKSLGADSLLIGADAPAASNVLREMNRQGFFIPVIGGNPLISSVLVAAAGKVPVLAPATFYVGEQRAKATDFVTKFRAHAMDIPEASRDPLQFDASIYDICSIFMQAILNGGVTNKPEDLAADRDRIMKYVTTLKNLDGVGGKLGFDANGDGAKDVYVVLVKDGKWVPVG